MKNIIRKRDEIIRRLKEEFENRGFKKAVIGLSGGIDSALSLNLTIRAIGKENVIVIRMPYKTSNPIHLEDAYLVAKMAGLPEENLLTRDITPMVEAFIAADTSTLDDPLRIGNIAARCRMITLFDIAKKEKALVVGTENKSENLFGYYTRFGDAASDIEPITSLYKTEVWEMAKGLPIPKRVIKKDPSADLWQGQTDEEELGVTYLEADIILSLLYDKKLSIEEAEKGGFSKAQIEKVIKAVEKNSFKKDLPICL